MANFFPRNVKATSHGTTVVAGKLNITASNGQVTSVSGDFFRSGSTAKADMVHTLHLGRSGTTEAEAFNTLMCFQGSAHVSGTAGAYPAVRVIKLSDEMAASGTVSFALASGSGEPVAYTSAGALLNKTAAQIATVQSLEVDIFMVLKNSDVT